jgi:hypothetical protein
MEGKAMSFLQRLRASLSYLFFGTSLPADRIVARLDATEAAVQELYSALKDEPEKPAEDLPQEKQSPEKIIDTSLGFKEFLGAAVSLSALVTALFYFSGRAFVNCFFQEMNIPHHQFELTVRQYSEMGWSYVAQYIFKIAYYCLLGSTLMGLLVLVVHLVGMWVSKQFLRNRTKPTSRLPLPRWSRSLLEPAVKAIKISAMATLAILAIVIVVALAGQEAGQAGMQAGREAILNAQHLTLISDHPLDIPDETVIRSSPDHTLYRYEGLYVLTYNQERYFLYRSLGVSVCRPERVFIVEADQVMQAILENRPANAPNCSP